LLISRAFAIMRAGGEERTGAEGSYRIRGWGRRHSSSPPFYLRMAIFQSQEEVPMLLMILVIVLILALVGSVPTWPHSRDWGYYPSGGLGVVLLIILVLFLMGHL